MDDIKIFIAGAKDLSKQRNLVKAWANDFNEESASSRIMVRSYENFVNNQSAYDRFIEKNADIVLFVIDGKIGAKTEDELKLASSCRDKNGKPKVFVFVKKFTIKTEAIEHVEDVVNKYVGDYYIEYENDEDLIAKTERHIKKYLSSRNAPITFKRICLILSIIIGLLVTCVSIFFSIGLGVSYLVYDKSESQIINDNIIPLDDYSALQFRYEDITCYYYIQNDSLGVISYNEEYNKVNHRLSKNSIFSALSISTSTLVLEKYTNMIAQKLGRGGKAQKVVAVCLIAGVYVGTFIGFSQGYAYGEMRQDEDIRENIIRLISDPETWVYMAQRLKKAKLLMQ